MPVNCRSILRLRAGITGIALILAACQPGGSPTTGTPVTQVQTAAPTQTQTRTRTQPSPPRRQSAEAPIRREDGKTVVIPLTSYISQQASTMRRQASQLVDQGQYARAVEVFEQVAALYQRFGFRIMAEKSLVLADMARPDRHNGQSNSLRIDLSPYDAPDRREAARLRNQNSPRARALLKQSNQARDRGDFTEALGFLDELEELAGRTILTLNARGYVWLLSRRPDKSIFLFEQAERRLGKTPDDKTAGQVYFGLGASLMHFLHPWGAEEYLARARNRYDRAGETALATTVREALKDAKMLADTIPPMVLPPTPQDDREASRLAAEGRRVMLRGDAETAELLLLRALELDHYNITVNHNAGVIMLARNRHVEAEGFFNRVLYIAIRYGDYGYQGMALDGLAVNLMRQGDHTGAIARFRDAIPLLQQSGMADTARQVQARLRKAEAAAGTNTGYGSDKRSQPRIPSPPTAPDPAPITVSQYRQFLSDGRQAMRDNDLPRLEQAQRGLVAARPDHAGHWNGLGKTLSMQGKHRAALDAHQKAHQIAVASANQREEAYANAEMGQAYALLGNSERGEKLILQGIEQMRPLRMTEDRANLHNFLMNVYRQQDRMIEALAQALSAVDAFGEIGKPERAVSAQFLIGTVLVPREDYVNGTKALRAVLDHGDPQRDGGKLATAHLLMGVVAIQIKDEILACQHFANFRKFSHNLRDIDKEVRHVDRKWREMRCSRRLS